VRIYKKEFEWLYEDPECMKAVNYLVAHAGYSESEERIKMFLRDAKVKDVNRVFRKLLERRVIVLEAPGTPYPYTLKIVTYEGSPYK